MTSRGPAALLLAVVASASASSAAAAPPCTTCRGPAFSWDTVPKFIHTSNATGPVNAGALALMAKFPMVTVGEKQIGGAGGSLEPPGPQDFLNPQGLFLRTSIQFT
jgi:hypothetical protein